MAKDFLGVELEVGNEIILSLKGKKSLSYGVITKISSKMVSVSAKRVDSNYWRDIKKYHNEVIQTKNFKIKEIENGE